MSKEKKIIFSLLLVFFMLRVGVACFIGKGTIPGDDSVGYNGYALTILKDFKWLSSFDFIASYREPVYPLFLALTYFLFGKENFIAVYILQALINTLTVFVIYQFALKIFGNKTARIALVCAGLYGPYLWFTACLLRETLVYLLVIAFIYFLYTFLTESSSKLKLVRLVLFFTLLIYTDSRYIYFLPGVLLLFMLYRHFWRAVRLFSVFIFLLAIFSLPWSIRNTVTYNKVFLGHMFYLESGKNLSVNIRKEYKKYQRGAVFGVKEKIFTTNLQYPSVEERELIRKGLNPDNRSAAEIAAIKKGVYPRTTFWGRKWFNLRELWRPLMLGGVYVPLSGTISGVVFQSWSFRHNLFSMVFYGTLLPCAIIGMITLAIQRKKFVYFLFIPLFFHTLFHTMTWGEWRFRVPIDSFLIILGSYGITFVYRSLVAAAKGNVCGYGK